MGAASVSWRPDMKRGLGRAASHPVLRFAAWRSALRNSSSPNLRGLAQLRQGRVYVLSVDDCVELGATAGPRRELRICVRRKLVEEPANEDENDCVQRHGRHRIGECLGLNPSSTQNGQQSGSSAADRGSVEQSWPGSQCPLPRRRRSQVPNERCDHETNANGGKMSPITGHG